MKIEDRLKYYSDMAETTRKWVSVMDAKAGFISALDGALLAFLWGSTKVFDGAASCERSLAFIASACALLSLIAALCVVMPRVSLSAVFGKGARYLADYKAVSFYGCVATQYPLEKETIFYKEVAKMDAADLAHEALEQHYTISHTVYKKSLWVARASFILILAILLTAAALVVREIF